MAKKQPNTSLDQSRSFVKGLTRDTEPSFIQDGMWNYARNASNNTREGDLGTLSNEESNALRSTIGADITVPNEVVVIGAIALFESKWIVYSAIYDGPGNNVLTSEIGLFEEEFDRYRPIVRDACLKFSKFHLVSGASREKQDCTWQVYWADGNNPDRYLNIGDPRLWPSNDYIWQGGLDDTNTINYYINGLDQILWPGVEWEEECKTIVGDQVVDPESEDNSGCIICEELNKLNCPQIRLSSLVKTPCVDIGVGTQQGLVLNGSYAVGLAYSINNQKVTNYFSLSYVQPIFNEVDGKGSLEINIEDLDTDHFDEYELSVAYIIKGIVDYKILGYYSINTKRIVLDQISESLENTNPSNIFQLNPVIETSKQIVEANRYLLKIGPKSRFDFNYQPLANLIKSEWVSVEYPETYYKDGNKNAGYLRDEVYAFFIRWVYDTGDKSASYHIPGRAPVNYNGIGLENSGYTDVNSFDGDTRLFETINTATVIPQGGAVDNGDGGKIIAAGNMGYWQSSEYYPADKPEVWNTSQYCWTNETSPDYDLCGTPIRHHKFPDNALSSQTHHFVKKPNGTFHIRLMGIRFKNITLPKDNDGNDIEGIVAYEILRGSRIGNKSVVAKGMVNNFRDYQLQGVSADNPSKVGLYANYPFNCIRPKKNSNNSNDFNYNFNDPYILSREGEEAAISPGDPGFVNQNIPTDMLSFHSPDTSFKTPYLQMSEMKIYGYLKGQAEQRFIEPIGHPEFQLLSDFVVLVGILGGIVNAILRTGGNLKINYPAGKWEPQYIPDVTGGDKNNKPAYKWGINSQVIFLPTPGGSATTTGGTAPPLGDGGTAANIDTHIVTNEDGDLLGNEEDYEDVSDTSIPDDEQLSPDKVKERIDDYNAFQSVFFGADSIDQIMVSIENDFATKGKYYTVPTLERDYTYADFIPNIPGVSPDFGLLLFHTLEGIQITIDLIKAIARFRQYALEQIGHGDYNQFKPANLAISRYSIEDGIYVFKEVQDFPEYLDSGGTSRSYRINNLNRPNKPVLRVTTPGGTQQGPNYIQEGGDYVDQSLMTLDYAASTFGNVSYTNEGKEQPFTNDIASYYAGLKFRIKNQYGQLDTVRQIIATPCEQKINFNNLSETQTYSPDASCPSPLLIKKIQESKVFFGGDTYINRFTEKNIMPFFQFWLYNTARGEEFNYFLYPSVPFPKFWANSQPWDISEINLSNFQDYLIGSNQGSGLLPSSYYNLDNPNYEADDNKTPYVDYLNPLSGGYPGLFTPKKSYFYLANGGIRDFFVESDVLVDFRTRGDLQRQYHYDKYRYTDLVSLFDINPDILKAGNFYDYEYSLSVSEFFVNQTFSLGALQGRSYDPTVSALCFTSSPNVINYSLPETKESIVESWRTFLPLNKVTFKNNVNSVKSFAKTGMFITFENASPLMYQGVDQREDYIGVSATIGDGLLFSATPRNVTAAESKYEFGSSQDRLGVLSSPAGLYFISQQQGKIFSYGDSLQEISSVNMKWWFDEFLPYKLIEDFPEFPHVDNPVAGVGCSIGYDNSNGVIYFSKKDYMLKPEFKGSVEYITNDKFSVLIGSDRTRQNKITVKLGDPRIFEDASWTISYDPKNQQWISFHDWHPNLYLSGRNKHYTTKLGGIWEHNAGCNDYCNFYGSQFPFEVGIPVPTGQNVVTVRSIEYYLECFKRDSQFCVDQYHVLDYNFDEAIITNSEQVSGYLNLNIFPKNNIALAQTYPKVNVNSVDILVSKEEQKYRFNQFWDITANRGEFPDGAGYPPTGQLIPGTTRLIGNYTENQIWNTKANGYIQDLNPVNLNYNKSQLQRKKFRHYNNFVRLIKKNPQDANMVLKVANIKNQNSPR